MKKLLFSLISTLILLVGCSNSVDIEGAKMSYEELVNKIEEQESIFKELVHEKHKLLDELDSLEREIESKREAIDEALEIYNNREEIENELKEKKEELEALENEISKKKEELATITGELKKKESEPIILSAGHYVVGSDLPPGRYIAEANGSRSGNFVVRRDGRLKVNTILGNGQHSEKEYVFDAWLNDTLELGTQIKFTPVE